MKKEYESPDFELTVFSFQDILQDGTKPLLVSDNEHGGNDKQSSRNGCFALPGGYL